MRPAPLSLTTLLCAILTLPGCAVFTDAPHYRGIAVTQHDLNELTPGISSQADVQALLGPPTFVEQFDNNNWDYVSQITKIRIGQTEGVKRQHVVVLKFNDSGILQGISEKDLKNRVYVAMDGAQTPVPGGKPSFIRQLIGGVGSYNPLGAAADTSSASSSASSLGGAPAGGPSSGSGF